MLMVISPAKKLDVESPSVTKTKTQASLLDDSQSLIDELKQLAPQDISGLMKLSDNLSTLNYDRYQAWQLPFSLENAKQAVLTFKGDVYVGLDAESFSREDFSFSQQHLRILSGLYGVLRPLDLMQAYRLEMGTKLENQRGKNLYEFWGDLVTDSLNKQLATLKSDCLVNLASNEYFKVVNQKKLDAEIVSPEFKDFKNGKYKIISFYAKKARGLMSRWIIENKLSNASQLSDFNVAGYAYSEELSAPDKPVFLRDEQ